MTSKCINKCDNTEFTIASDSLVRFSYLVYGSCATFWEIPLRYNCLSLIADDRTMQQSLVLCNIFLFSYS